MSTSEIDLRLTPDPEAASVARRSLGDLQELISAEKLEDLRLLVTELVTNSVRHASLEPTDVIRFRLEIRSGLVRAQVYDSGPGFGKPSFDGDAAPVPMSLSKDGTVSTGLGLYLVERLVQRWGVERGECTCVWFETNDGRESGGAAGGGSGRTAPKAR